MLKSEQRKRREAAILSTLDKLGIGTASQLKTLDAGGLGRGSKRNALRVLREMEADGLVVSKRVGTKLFRVYRDDMRKREGFGFWEHTYMRNEFLIRRGWFYMARMEVPIRVDGEVVLIADVGLKNNEGKWMFVEVDRQSKKKTNEEKVRLYRKYEQPFVVVCFPERRKFWENLNCEVFVTPE